MKDRAVSCSWKSRIRGSTTLTLIVCLHVALMPRPSPLRYNFQRRGTDPSLTFYSLRKYGRKLARGLKSLVQVGPEPDVVKIGTGLNFVLQVLLHHASHTIAALPNGNGVADQLGRQVSPQFPICTPLLTIAQVHQGITK